MNSVARIPDYRAIAESFGRNAAHYESFADFQRLMIDALTKQLMRLPGEDNIWLDLGCGACQLARTAFLQRTARKIICIDIALPALKLLQSKGPLRACPILADIEGLPFAAPFCDRIVIASSLQWTANPTRTLREARKLLRADGHMGLGILLDGHLQELRSVRRALGLASPVQFPSLATAHKMIARAGLKIEWQKRLARHKEETPLRVIRRVVGIGAAPRTLNGRRGDLWRICREYRNRFPSGGKVRATSDALLCICGLPQ